jgi:membrane-bound lytic murein transglycosylase C
MKKLMVTCLAAILIFVVTMAQGQKDNYPDERRLQQEQWKELTKEGDDLFRETEQEWNNMLREQQEAWEQMVAEINRIWLDTLTTTKKEWVDYSDQYSTRSYVNFEKGDIVLATMIKASESRITELSKERIRRQLAKILSSDNPSRRAILAGQIADDRRQPVSQQTLDRYLNREVFPKLSKARRPVVGKDGVPRYKVSVPIKMVPNHTMVRAQPYIPEVRRQAQRFRLRPELIMAVIHTESYFDPMARSHAPAYGLMQLVPIYGAREAYQFVYGQDRVLPANYLYQPANNIELGTAYLNLLIYKHFVTETNPLKNLYLSVCGYNWGPSAIRRKIINRYPTSSMSPEQLYQVLRQRTPQETRDYLQRVTQRMGMYQPLFGG